MTLSERTIKKLKNESAKIGGNVYENDAAPLEEDVTHFEEDSDPLTHAGEPEDDKPVGEVPDDQKEGNA